MSAFTIFVKYMNVHRIAKFINNIFEIFRSGALRLFFVLATEHTLLRIYLNIWDQILFPGDLHDDAP